MLTSSRIIVNQLPPIDVLVLGHVADRLGDWTPERRGLLLARAGFAGPRPSLKSAADPRGITKQAAQILVKRGLRDLKPLPALLCEVTADVWSFMARMTPARWQRVRDELVKARYIEHVEFEGLVALRDLMGAEPELRLIDTYLVGRDSDPPPVARALRHLKSRVRSNGAYELHAVIDHLGLGAEWQLEDFGADVAAAGWARSLGSDWIAERSASKRTDRLAHLTRKVLCACGPIKVEQLMDALERQVRFGRLPCVLPAQVLEAYLLGHGDFEIDQGTVGPSGSLDPERELSRTELVVWRRFKEAGESSLSRNELRTSALAAGIDLAAFASVISYSPMLESRGHGHWALRGSPAFVAKDNAPSPPIPVSRSASKTTRASRYTWDQEGRLVITSVLSSPESTVVSIPQAVQVILHGKDFPAFDTYGRSIGTIKVRHGRSWGFDRFLAEHQRGRGELLSVTFDLTNRLSTVSVAPVPND